jgi:hypothetical protein
VAPGRIMTDTQEGYTVIQEKIRCEACGQLLALSRMQRHMQGLRHRKAADIRKLLDNPCTTFREVAARFKVSPELLRIIVKGMGLATGRERHRAQRLASAEKAVRQYLKGLPVFDRPGFVVEPVVVDYPGRRRRVHLRHVIINGHRCAVRSAVRPPSVVDAFGDWWVRIKPVKTTLPVDFVLYRLPPACPARGWLVVPARYVPKYELSVNLAEGPKDHPLARAIYRGRWRKYLNAWDQLR